MKKGLLIGLAVLSVMWLAVPAMATSTGDQKGPACTDIEKATTILNEVPLIADPDGEGPLPGVMSNEWFGDAAITLSDAPCTNVTYRLDWVIYGDGGEVDTSHSEILTASDFTINYNEDGSVDYSMWESEGFTIDELESYEPTDACYKVEALLGPRHVADASPDGPTDEDPEGQYELDEAGRACGLGELETNGARSYGARSYG